MSIFGNAAAPKAFERNEREFHSFRFYSYQLVIKCCGCWPPIRLLNTTNPPRRAALSETMGATTTTRNKEEDLRESPLLGLLGMIVKNVLFNKLVRPGIFGFSSFATAEEVTEGIHASNLTAIITGASSGLGLETTRVLALRGVRIIMAVRNVEAGQNVKDKILHEIDGANIEVMKVDVSSLQSVRDFCDNFKSMGIPLNILINNAGMIGGPFLLSADGIELNFATNYLGPFLLTRLLLPNMISTAKDSGIQGRIINVSSESHYYGSLGDFKLASLNDKSRYWSYLAYARSKLANILHANELAARLQDEGAQVTINSCHPGIIMTNIVHNNRLLQVGATYAEKLARLLFLKTIPQGAATQCFLALHPKVQGVNGKYFQNCAYSKRSKSSRSKELGEKLWNFTETLLTEMDVLD